MEVYTKVAQRVFRYCFECVTVIQQAVYFTSV